MEDVDTIMARMEARQASRVSEPPKPIPIPPPVAKKIDPKNPKTKQILLQALALTEQIFLDQPDGSREQAAMAVIISFVEQETR